MNSVPIIRTATLKDLDALLAIEKASFSSDGFQRRQMRYLLSKAKSQAFVVVVGGSIGGYAILLTPEKRQVARLYSIAVAKAFQSQGFGRKLLQHCLQQAMSAGFQAVVLEVRAHDQKVTALYTSLGFKATQYIKHYYADGEDAVRMRWYPQVGVRSGDQGVKASG